MEQTCRRVVIMAFSLALLMSSVQETSQDKKVTYLLGRPAENCTSVCASRGMSCIEVGGFPSNALHIFHSLNITCTTYWDTNEYHYKDHPNYFLSGNWRGRCMGFKIPNATWHSTLCGIGHNRHVRRLCPCEKLFSTTNAPSTTPPPSSSSSSSSSSPTTTALPSSSKKVISTTAIMLGTQTRDQDQYTSAKTELGSWQIAVVTVAAVLIICGLLVVVLLVRKRRNRSPPKIRSAPEQKRMKSAMDGTDNIVYMESMVDVNISASCGEENQTTRTSNNPIYEANVADELRHEQNLADDYEAGDFVYEYASIDQIQL